MAEVDLGIPGYEWRSTLGRGGSGTVHEAFDTVHGRTVAVKVLDTMIDDTIRRRFDRERRAMGSLGSHPNVVTVLTSGYSAHDQPYLVMERLEGGSLADVLRSGPLTVDQVVTIGVQLADALAAAHRSGIVHCDVKPANVLLTDDHRPQLTDFGIASIATDRSMRMTVSATPSYAAPEILQGRDPDQRADIYSLAATLFACLDGYPPYGNTSETMLGVLYQIINAPVPTLERAGVPAHVGAALRQAMAKDPEDRPATMAEFADLLTGTTAASASTPVPAVTSVVGPDVGVAPSSGRRRRTLILGTAVAVVAAVTAALVVRAATRGPDQVAIPDVGGMPLVEATGALEQVGLEPDHDPACDSAIARATTPAAGSEVDTGASVAVDIDACIVPDFVGMRLPEAIDLIMTIDGLSISWDDYCDDLVLGQDPAPGTALDFGSSIAIELRPC
ncbi:MAG: protein kinase [Acidimicrobiales bacterium]